MEVAGRDRPLLQAQPGPHPRPLGTAGVRNPVDVSFPLLGMGGPRHRVHFRPPAKPSGSWPLYGSPNRCWTGAPDSAFLLLSCTVHVCGESARPQPRGHGGDAGERTRSLVLLLFCFGTVDGAQHPAAETHTTPCLNVGQQKTQEENSHREGVQGRLQNVPLRHLCGCPGQSRPVSVRPMWVLSHGRCGPRTAPSHGVLRPRPLQQTWKFSHRACAGGSDPESASPVGKPSGTS